MWSVPGIRVLAAMTVFGFAGYAVLLPVAPLWAVRGGAGEAGAGLVNFVLLAATVATQTAVPRLLHRFGWSAVLGSGLALMGIGAVAQPVSDALPAILALAAVRGAGFGILTVTGSAAAGLLVDPGRRGAAIGAYGLAVALPNLVLLPLGPLVVAEGGFTLMFLIAGLPLLGVPLAPALARHLQGDEDDPQTAGGRPDRALIPPAAILLGVTLAGGAIITFAPQIVDAPVTATWGLFLLGLVAALSRWRAGALADRHGPGPFLAPLVGVTVVAMAAVAFAVRAPEHTALFLAACALLGLSYGALQNLTLVLALASVPRSRTHTASAVWNIGFDAGTALGSVLVGMIAAGVGFPTAMLVAGLLSLPTLPLALRARSVGSPAR